MTGLETFTPLTRTVRAAGRDVAIAPLRLRQMVAVAAAAQPVIGLLWIADYIAILDSHPAQAHALLVAACGLTQEEADDLDSAEVVELLSAWHEVNADFLLRRLGPATRAARQAASALLDRMGPEGGTTTGPASSPGSASADTGSTTAST